MPAGLSSDYAEVRSHWCVCMGVAVFDVSGCQCVCCLSPIVLINQTSANECLSVWIFIKRSALLQTI